MYYSHRNYFHVYCVSISLWIYVQVFITSKQSNRYRKLVLILMKHYLQHIPTAK